MNSKCRKILINYLIYSGIKTYWMMDMKMFLSMLILLMMREPRKVLRISRLVKRVIKLMVQKKLMNLLGKLKRNLCCINTMKRLMVSRKIALLWRQMESSLKQSARKENLQRSDRN